MTVMVMVTPGSEPPITPMNVPANSGSMYFHCAMLTRRARANQASEPCPCAAWQQHQQVSFEDQMARRGGAERDRGEHRPLPHRSRPAQCGLQRTDEQDRGEAKPQ